MTGSEVLISPTELAGPHPSRGGGGLDTTGRWDQGDAPPIAICMGQLP